MAFFSTVEHIGNIRRHSHSPAKTGHGAPRPAIEMNLRAPVTRPPISIVPRCVPKSYAYPSYLRLPIGPNEKGKYHLVRYACLKTTIKWLKIKQAITQKPIYHKFPIDQLPVSLFDRNSSGTTKVSLNRVASIKEYVIPDGLETLDITLS
jgi:hypothetical protein